MAPMSKNKRKTAVAGLSAAPAKRQKLAGLKAGLSKKKRAVNLDSLSWTPVDIPEMFNDAEGFYNLEMIEGVEVVKDGDNVEFRVVDDQAGQSEQEADDFEGFSDNETPAEEDTKMEAEPTDAKKQKGKTQNEPVANLKDATDVIDPTSLTETTDATEAEAKPANGNKKKQEKKDEKKKETKAEKRAKAKKERDDKKKEKKAAGPKAQEATEDADLESNVFNGLDEAAEEEEELDMSKWMALDLSTTIVNSIARLKFPKPTAIQAATIPEIIAGHDVIGKASTGSGKTLAFAIPIVERWLEKQPQHAEPVAKPADDERKTPLALVISPTRELAHQIVQHIKALCEGMSPAPYICSVTGGLSVFKQQRQLAKADIVVGTPGRMWEVLSTEKALLESFKGIQYLVVDEADRILSEGHFKEAEEIFKAIDRQVTEEDDEEAAQLVPRQTLVFSATFHKGLQQKLAGKGKFGLMSDEESMEYLLKKVNFREEVPKFIDMNPISQMADGLKEGMVECGAMEKDLYLYALILLNPNRRSLVFTNSISTVRRLTPMLQNLNINAVALHSQMPQKARLRSVEKFSATKPGTTTVLIATDVAARGLDIKGIEQVVHYHVPRAADMYVHRSGRTARANTAGLSVLLCAPEEVTPVRRLAAKVHHERAAKKKYMIHTIDLDRKLVSRLKPRMDLAKKIADAMLAKEKGGKDDDWVKQAAEDLGVEYDSEELEKSSNWGGRGSQRKKKQQENRAIPKAEMAAMRAQLRELLSKRINAGVSERYITSGKINVEGLLKGSQGDFLGKVDLLDLDNL